MAYNVYDNLPQAKQIVADASKHESNLKPESCRAWGQRLLIC